MLKGSCTLIFYMQLYFNQMSITVSVKGYLSDDLFGGKWKKLKILLERSIYMEWDMDIQK